MVGSVIPLKLLNSEHLMPLLQMLKVSHCGPEFSEYISLESKEKKSFHNTVFHGIFQLSMLGSILN